MRKYINSMRKRGFTPLENRDISPKDRHAHSHNGTEKKVRHNSPTGFTLLELVVVVAIVGLLASVVVVPNLIRFQQRAAASRMKAAADEIVRVYEIAATEGCTNLDITVGGVMDCDLPLPARILISAVPANPSTGPRFDLDPACNNVGGFQTFFADLDPSAGTILDFCLRGFLQGTGAFMCEQGSCSCSVDGECVR